MLLTTCHSNEEANPTPNPDVGKEEGVSESLIAVPQRGHIEEVGEEEDKHEVDEHRRVHPTTQHLHLRITNIL